MRIKKFTAKNLKEGKLKVQKELGEDAVVLSSRSVKTPEGNDIVEIVAAIENNKPEFSPPARTGIQRREEISAETEAATDNEFYKTAGHLFDEIGTLKDMIREMSETVKYKFSGSLGPVLGRIYKALRKEDFSEDFTLNIVGQLSATGQKEKLREALEETRNLITEKIKIMPPLEKAKSRRVITFTGPTGAGKTLTLVKLAIVCKLVLKAEVLLVSSDTYKVGGSEQLQTFASIGGISFREVYSPDELKALLNNEINWDFIFIDTTGRNPEKEEHMEEISAFLDVAQPDYNFLIQSANISRTSFSYFEKKFRNLKPNGLILTKVDETPLYGGIIEALLSSSLPLAYIADGQKVPDDINPATKEYFADRILSVSEKS